MLPREFRPKRQASAVGMSYTEMLATMHNSVAAFDAGARAHVVPGALPSACLFVCEVRCRMRFVFDNRALIP